MSASKNLVEQLQIWPRTRFQYPFDSIALSMISKGFALAEACVILASQNHVDEAYGLSRSLVEEALILRYLTSNDERQSAESLAFVNFSKSYKEHWLHHARKNISGTISPLEIEQYVAKFDLGGDPKLALQGWSMRRFDTYKTQHFVHPLDASWFTKDVKSAAYAVDYFQTSQSVHCSQPALDNFFPEELTPFKITASTGQFHASASNLYFKLLVYLHQLLRYALFGLSMPGGEALDRLLEEQLEALLFLK